MRLSALTFAAVLSASPALAQRDSVPYTPIARPDTIRGLYVNRWAVLGQKMWDLVDVANRTEVNAFVIDVKDDRGLILYRSKVPLAREVGADTTNPVSAARIRAVLDTMRANGIFPIARIVVAKDPLLANAKRDWAIQRKSDGTAWLDANGNPWLDAHRREIWQYAADLAKEAVGLGFSEVQFDYVRFPDDPRIAKEAKYPLAKKRPHAQVIHEQLGFLHDRMKQLGAPMSIDVFGLTTSDSTDMGIGQKWELFAEQTDIVQPMTYPSHYSAGMYGLPSPNASPYQVIDRAMKDAKTRNTGVASAPIIVPWYQDFTLGAPKYGVEELRAQMQAGYDNGIYSWLLWNAGSNYTTAAFRPKGAP